MTFPTFADLVEICRPITRDQLDALCRKAETGEQWAEICRLVDEAEEQAFNDAQADAHYNASPS